jgi:predicted GNAT family N-acyltransferase
VSVSIRDATPGERAWADERYREIQFAPTRESHRVLVAEQDGAPVGLGRLVPIEPGVVELGGIWTSDAARGAGVARRMVAALLERAAAERDVWCVPFSHLVSFYESFGFTATPPPWPEPIAAKVQAAIALGHPVGRVLRLAR